MREEWRFQHELETETLLHLQKFGNFPQDLNICISALNEIIDVPTESTGDRVNNGNERKRKRKKHNTKETPTVVTYCNVHPIVKSFDLWLSRNEMKRLPHKTFQYGNCLYESVANLILLWLGKPVELRFRTIEWARLQVTEGTSWGLQIWTRFDDRNGNNDNYGKISFLDYLAFMEDPKIYGTEYNLFILCEFLNISIKVYTSSLVKNTGDKISVELPFHYGEKK
jgi:hypothetical protein